MQKFKKNMYIKKVKDELFKKLYHFMKNHEVKYDIKYHNEHPKMYDWWLEFIKLTKTKRYCPRGINWM